MKNKLSIKLIVTLTLLFCVSALFAQYGEYQRVSILLKWNHQFQFAGYYAALKKGYYKAEGLDVNLVENNINQSSADRVITGDADYGVGGSELIVERSKGKPVVVLASIFQHSPLALISRAESNLKNLSNYIGKTIMCTEYDKYEINLMFLRYGIYPDQVKYVKHDYTVDALINQRVDAVVDYVSLQPYLLSEKNIEPYVIRPSEYGIDFYGDALFTSENEIARNPRRVEQITRATLKGWEYAMNNKEEIIDYILTLPNVEKRGVTRERLQYEAQKIEDLIQPNLVEIGQMKPQRWEKMAQMFAQQGFIGKDWDIKGFLYEPSNPEHGQRIVIRIIVIILGAVVVMLLIVFLILRQLKSLVVRRTAELVRVSQRDEALLNAIPDILLMFDRNYYIVDYHPKDNISSFHTLPERFLGKSISESMPENIADIAKQHIDAVFASGKASEVSYLLPRFDNNKHYEARFVPCGQNEVLAFIRDITERVQQEEELLASQEELKATSEALKINLQELEVAKAKAEEANVLKTLFLANMSHEIRTPMNGILGFIQILHDMDLTREEQESYINLLHESGKRLLDTINNIIEMSKIEAGHVEVKNAITNLGDMLGYLYSFFHPMANQKGIELYLDISEDEKKVNVVTDQHKVEAILSNLIRNAIKFTDSGMVMFGFNILPGEIVFYVKDTGVGIPKERIDAIFERFVQADLDMSRNHEGAGLGLSISKGYVDILNGKMWVESEKDKGSKFFFSIPVQKK